MTQSQKERCKRIVNHYGESAQLLIVQEEAAELIVSICKVRRDSAFADKKFLDALADMTIMLGEMEACMDDDEHTEFYKIINEKLDAQLNIINKGEQE